MSRPHPASRLLLVYAALLPLMLVAALAIASIRNAPPADADAEAPATNQPIQAVAR